MKSTLVMLSLLVATSGLPAWAGDRVREANIPVLIDVKGAVDRAALAPSVRYWRL